MAAVGGGKRPAAAAAAAALIEDPFKRYRLSPVFHVLAKAGLIDEIGKMILDLCLIDPTLPYKSFDHQEGISYVLPQGLSENGVIQELAQKQRSFFYGIARLLTERQIDCDFANHCLVRQAQVAVGEKVVKDQAARDKQNPEPLAMQTVQAMANTTFFRSLGLDANVETQKFQLDFYARHQRLYHPNMSEEQVTLLAKRDLACVKQKVPHTDLSFAKNVAEKMMVKEFGLKPLRYDQYMTVAGLVGTLQRCGPFVVSGDFGLAAETARISTCGGFYAGKKRKAEDVATTRAEHTVHPIVVVGAIKKDNGWNVCWVDPNDYHLDQQLAFEAPFQHFTDCIGLITHSPTNDAVVVGMKHMYAGAYYNPLLFEVNPRLPYKLYDEPNFVFWQMPHGKIGKNGQVAVQKAQKGQTCFYYALKRILTIEQIRTEHGRQCSERRKAMTVIDEQAAKAGKLHLRGELVVAYSKVNSAFLRQKTVPADEASAQMQKMFGAKLYEVEGREVTFGQLFQSFFKDSKHQFIEDFQATHRSADVLMAHGYGLKHVLLTSYVTKEGLLEALRTKGPFVIAGRLGLPCYSALPMPFGSRMGGCEIHGWTTEPLPNLNYIHAIVVIGAEIDQGGQGFVYFNDPNDASDPNNPNLQRIFKISFETFINNVGTIYGLPENAQILNQKNLTAQGYYNPLFAK